LEIAADGFGGVGIAWTRKNAAEQRIALHAAIPLKFDARYDILRSAGLFLRLSTKGLAGGQE
jgi:hypothetical protein